MLQNVHRIEGDEAVLALTQGQETRIDAGDLAKALQHRWHVAYNLSMGSYYVISKINGKTTYLHRFLLDAPNGMTVDHVNHDTLDNRRANIRLCTMRENGENRRGAYKNNQLGIRGISTYRNRRQGLTYYMVRVAPGGKQIVKYFPHTPDGLERAKQEVLLMRQQYFTHQTET